MSKNIRKFLTLLVVILFVSYFLINKAKFRPILDVNFYWLIIIIIVDILAIASNGLFIKFILQPFDKFISFIESAYVSLISSVGNFFAPVGAGFGFRAVYLKKKHGLPYGEYMSTLSGNYIIVFLVNSFFALLALGLLHKQADAEYATLVVLFAGLFILSLTLSLVRLPENIGSKLANKKAIGKVIKNVMTVLKGWNKITKNKKLMLRLTGLISFNFLMSIFIARVEISALHFHIGFAQLLLFSVLGSLSLFVNITPANLGVKEAIYIFSSSVIGFSTSQILLIALVDRGILFLTLGVLWLLFIRPRRGESLLEAN